MRDNDHVYGAAILSGIACLEAGCWIAMGTGYALMLTGGLILFGCWMAA